MQKTRNNRWIALGAALVGMVMLAGCEFDSLGGFDPSAQPRGYTPPQATAQEDAGPGGSGHSD